MANALYPKLALTNLGKNKSTYFPYMLTSIVCIMTYYIMQSIAMNEGLMEVPGAAIAMTIFFLGTGIIAVFCIALMFYTNSFLIKRRKKELGLYCVLGMEKRHVALVLFFETLFTAIACLALGLVFGVLFSKLLFMALLYLLDFATPLAFSVSVPSLVTTVVLFACIYGATLLYNMVHIRLANPVELLHGGQKGEKEPKTSWLLTFVGLAALAGGYFIAVYFKSPLNALLLFFVAVFLVILGTFCLFTAGSIALLKALRRRKNFYYRPNNFIAVSGMMYRMKQNAAGLAAICILSTMVLVTISTTVSLYMGRNDMVTSMYPREICSNSTAAENAPAVQDAFAQSTRALGLEIKNPIAGRSRSLNVISVDGSYEDAPASVSSGEVVAVSLVPLLDYNSTFGTNFQLASGEALAYPTGNFVLSDTVTLGGQAVHIAQRLDESPYIGSGNYTAITGLILVVPDEEATSLYRAMGGTQEQFAYSAAFDVDATPEQIAALQEDLWTRLNGICGIYARSELYTEWNAMYGSFLFLGIFLGCLFLMATVLIIYYKQISEGYEDHDRFRIMQQVGMSRKEVKRAINKQILLVFFLPLLMAALHMVFAFEIIYNMLLVFGMVNRLLFFGCTAVTFLIFAAAYVVVYRITARTYYRLVEA